MQTGHLAQNPEKLLQFCKTDAGDRVGCQDRIQLPRLFRGRLAIEDGMHQLNVFSLSHFNSSENP